MSLDFLLAKLAHAIGFTFWLGGLTAAALVAGLGAPGGTSEARAAFARAARRLGALADAGATLALLGGLYMIVTVPGLLRLPWLHVKLTLIVLLIGVHVAARVKVRRLAEPGHRFPGPIVPLLLVLGLGIFALAVLQARLIG